MSTKLKTCLIILNFIIHLLHKRPFINILHDIAKKYEGINVGDLRKFDQFTFKFKKACLDITFLNNCKNFGVFPKFISFKLPGVSQRDVIGIRKKLLRSAIREKNKAKIKAVKELNTTKEEIRKNLSTIDFYILNKIITDNNERKLKESIKTHEKKLRKLTKNIGIRRIESKKIITNLTNYQLTQEETDILASGLSFSIAPLSLKKSDIFTSFENINRFLTKNLKDESDKNHMTAELSHLANTYFYNYTPSPRILHQHKILKNLKNNRDIVICKPDKGNGVVIVERKNYDEALLSIINDTSKFEKLKEDPTRKREASLQRFLRKLKKDSFISDSEYSKVYPNGTAPAKIYGLPKLHKFKKGENLLKFRPIVSSIGTFNYDLSKYLANILSPLIPSKHSSKDTFTFIKDLHGANLTNKFFVSYDVTSLFTNIPLNETINHAVDLIFQANPNIKINKFNLTKLFKFCTSQTHFLFNGNYYNQTDGVAMGSPLAPVLANIFMGINEDKWINNYDKTKPVFYRRYVDDILAVFDNEQQANDFFEYINKQHPNLKFTMEINTNNQIPFLDTHITNIDKNIITKTYHKPTYTGLLLNFKSFAPFPYKINLIKCLIDRAFKINNTWTGFNSDIKSLTNTLIDNSYPKPLIDKQVNHYIEKFYNNNIEDNETNQQQSLIFFKLPFIGRYSNQTKTKINNLIKNLCKPNTKIKLVFSSFKIKQFFSYKDKTPLDMKSMIVYQFTCASCGARYIGETIRHFRTRMDEHVKRDNKSNVFKHLNDNNDCLNSYNSDCFKILDSASSNYELKIKEALHINWGKPELNAQVKHYNISIIA